MGAPNTIPTGSMPDLETSGTLSTGQSQVSGGQQGQPRGPAEGVLWAGRCQPHVPQSVGSDSEAPADPRHADVVRDAHICLVSMLGST